MKMAGLLSLNRIWLIETYQELFNLLTCRFYYFFITSFYLSSREHNISVSSLMKTASIRLTLLNGFFSVPAAFYILNITFNTTVISIDIFIF